jgi:hypothetical protein
MLPMLERSWASILINYFPPCSPILPAAAPAEYIEKNEPVRPLFSVLTWFYSLEKFAPSFVLSEF